MMNTNSEPREIERKYLIKRPSAETLAALPQSSSTDIVQTYLAVKENGARRRVRKRGSSDGGWKYYYTEKTDVAFGERIEIERETDEREYDALLAEADPNRMPIVKTRVCFVYEGQFFELDIYPFSEALATLEIELDDINAQVRIPECITVLKDVTGDKRYNNSSLAASQSLEIPD